MLVKFDHLTLVVSRDNVEQAISSLKSKGYKQEICEDNAINSQTKLQFMKYKDETHGLYFMSAPDNNGIPIELIAYNNTTKGNSLVDYTPGENLMTIKTSDCVLTRKLFETIGCEIKEEKAIFNGALDPRPYEIVFASSSEVASNLDNEGFCCPTFFVRPASKTRNALADAGFFVSDYEYFTVQDKSMYVFFAKDENGTLIEFVSSKL